MDNFNSVSFFFFFLWLYSTILGLGCLHETFRFISVTRSRTIGRTPWTGDCDDGEVGGMKRVLAEETEVLGANLPRRHFVHHKPHLRDPVANPGRRGGKPATNRFSYGAACALLYPVKLFLLCYYRFLFNRLMPHFSVVCEFVAKVISN
jgi:hypothetical protein